MFITCFLSYLLRRELHVIWLMLQDHNYPLEDGSRLVGEISLNNSSQFCHTSVTIVPLVLIDRVTQIPDQNP